MNEIYLHLDAKAVQEMNDLKNFYKLPSTLATIRVGLNLLMTAKKIEESNGQLIAKKDDKQTIINIV